MQVSDSIGASHPLPNLYLTAAPGPKKHERLKRSYLAGLGLREVQLGRRAGCWVVSARPPLRAKPAPVPRAQGTAGLGSEEMGFG